jgi:transposase
VFLDETGLNTKMTRLYGRSAKGERCHAAVPFGHWQPATFIAALRDDRLSAPWLIDGPMDGLLFLTYLREVLGPELRRGDLVICDNLSSHKVQGVREAIGACGARLRYLPAYSPDLNPIEMAFAKLKAHLRSAAARNWESLIEATAAALASFSPNHCRNFLSHANYATN